MLIGLDWDYRAPDEWERVVEIGPEWTKHGVMLDGGPSVEGTRADMEACAGVGVRNVADLRTSGHSWFAQTAPPEGWRWELSGWDNTDLFAGWAARVGEVVRDLGDLCCDWEVWGEAPCLWTGQNLWTADRYLRLLRATERAIRAVQPGARVWFGGHGVNGNVTFWREVEERGASGLYDVQNLHPFMHDREWGRVELLLHGMFAEIRRTENVSGLRHALAATEFGWPSHPSGAGVAFNSHVERSVVSLDEETAAEWMDRTLRLFAEEGMQEVCILKLRDGADETHWGAHLGLYRRDWTPKPALAVVREWCRRQTDA